jgi:hypothetical protein
MKLKIEKKPFTATVKAHLLTIIEQVSKYET